MDKQSEIDDNLEFFKKKLPDLLKDNRDKYALLHKTSIVGIYDTVMDANTTGNKMYPDGMFSIQKITDTSVDLGYFSHAGSLG